MSHNVLLLGAGLVSRPLVRYLLDRPGFHVTVASRTVSKAEAHVGDHERGVALQLDAAAEPERVDGLVAEHDLVVSLLPWTMHVPVAERCLAHGKHFVTTSYVSDALRKLDKPAEDAGLTFLNEIGVDPGIDHMSAMKIITDVQGRGGSVDTFHSFCGGLPAPEANDNPLGYKFSWSPRGVLLAGRNDARFLEDGQERVVPGAALFDSAKVTAVAGLGELEVYPNRNSVPYGDIYGLQGIQTLMRGTFRNLGWCTTLSAIAELGWLDDEERELPETWADLSTQLAGSTDPTQARAATASKLKIPADDPVLEPLGWLGLFDESPIRDTSTASTRLDVLCDAMQQRMGYASRQRDMVVMEHRFVCSFPDRQERITSTMIAYGEPGGDSAMASTVALPAAIAVRHILEGTIDRRGVCIPTTPDIYEPVMDELAGHGVRFDDVVTTQPA